MPVTVEGAINTEEMLLRLDTTAKKRVTFALSKRALMLQAMAIKMAPVDEHNLEKAIKTRGTDSMRARDDSGRFQKRQIEVYIDLDMEVIDPHRNKPATVGQYAYEIHEHLHPAGTKELGIKSQLKQATSDVVVGGGFLDRAVEAVIDSSFDEELVEILRDL